MDLALSSRSGQTPATGWTFLRRFVIRYDAAIFSLPGFAHRLPIPKFLIYPSIDPLSRRNREIVADGSHTGSRAPWNSEG